MSARLDEMAKSNLALLVYTKGEKDAKQPQSNSLQRAEALVETLQAEAKSPQSNFFKAITELKCSILSSARVIAGFFLPTSDDSLLSQRYWSVINAILEVSLNHFFNIKAKLKYRQIMTSVLLTWNLSQPT